MNIKLSAANIVSIIILMCILAAMVSVAIMQVVRTVEDIGPSIYIVGEGCCRCRSDHSFNANHPR